MKSILAAVIAASIFYCYQSAAQEKQVSVKTLVKTSQSWDGSSLPNYPNGTPEITVLDINIPAGTTLPLHFHPVINAGVLLSGNLKVTKPNGEVLMLKAGDPIVELVNKVHTGKALGDEDVRIIVFYAGEKGKPITVKK
ncbi:cupin domain-containing protein [Pseudoalteromonas luteoviolacea]|uniref:cupin domain-containing protein n=1 Tax=Pseudoalteromonas luteoviolacea TaxID=43657 RepID=UPI001B362495|nr:cupin domain-containing protein [Pseudoalteromonas luteoviolacea]MBQ4812551.1 cupin domain-containing protein [Pseudoalteromonas luteoviolacea]